MKMIQLRAFNNHFSANITLTKLQSRGVECYLKDEHTVIMDPIISNAIGGIKLVVRERDAEEAAKLLTEFDEEYLKAVVCPSCGKAEITQIIKPAAGNYLTAILTWAFASYAIAPNHIYQCGNCKYETETLPNTINEEDLHE